MHQMLIRTHEKERCVVDAVVLLCAVRAGAGQGMGRGAWAGVRQGKQNPTMMWGIAIGWLFLLRKLQSIKITTKVRICKLNEIPTRPVPAICPAACTRHTFIHKFQLGSVPKATAFATCSRSLRDQKARFPRIFVTASAFMQNRTELSYGKWMILYLHANKTLVVPSWAW